MPPRSILILGGTRAARELAGLLLADGFSPVTSLAGATSQPLMPPGKVRIGGFGGAEGLASYVKAEGIAAIVDATHPFAAVISANAIAAAKACGVPLLRLERPEWQAEPGDAWIVVPSISAAVDALPSGARVLATIGRKEVASLFARNDIGGVARMIEAPPDSVPQNWTVLRERPPFTEESERHLITHHAITHLVTKSAGGEDTAAKLAAARALHIPVVMIARPAKPPAPACPDGPAVARELRRLLLP